MPPKRGADVRREPSAAARKPLAPVRRGPPVKGRPLSAQRLHGDPVKRKPSAQVRLLGKAHPLARRVLGRMGAACHGRWADVVVRGRMHLRPPLPQSDGVPQAELHGWHRVFISLRLPLVACAPCFYNVLSRMLHWFCFWRPETKTYAYKSVYKSY